MAVDYQSNDNQRTPSGFLCFKNKKDVRLLLEDAKNLPDESKIILNVDQGTDYSEQFSLTDETGPLDMTNCTFKFGARYSLQDRRAAIAATCKPLEGGILELNLPSKVTALLRADNPDSEFNRMYFDVIMIKDGKTSRVINGEIHVTPGTAHREADISA